MLRNQPYLGFSGVEALSMTTELLIILRFLNKKQTSSIQYKILYWKKKI